MIIDTTYLLPLSRVSVDTDLLESIDAGGIKLAFSDIGVSSISLFELQAKGAKLKVPAKFTIEAIEVILDEFRVEHFYNPKIIEISHILSRQLNDYIDCIILGTAIALKEDLVTEDSKLMGIKKQVWEKYRINIFNYTDLKTT
jgi:predicted nucleic acid-binding protein